MSGMPSVNEFSSMEEAPSNSDSVDGYPPEWKLVVHSYLKVRIKDLEKVANDANPRGLALSFAACACCFHCYVVRILHVREKQR